MCVRTFAAIVLLTLFPSTRALAGNDDELFVGSKAAMMGGAVSATVADPSAAWYNPAGLASITVDRIEASGTAYSLRRSSIPTFIIDVGGQSAGASVTEFVSVPSQVALAHRLSAQLSLGVGYFAPQASEQVLRESLDMQGNQTRQRVQVTLSEQSAHHAGVVALGVRISRRLRFGFSAIVTLQDEVESFGLAALAQGQGTSPASLLDTQLTTTTIVVSELGAGVQWDVGTRYHLGLALRSPRLRLHQSVHATVSEVASSAEEVELRDLGPVHSGLAVVGAGRAGFSFAREWASGSWVSAEIDVQPGLRSLRAQVNRRSVVNGRLGGYWAVHPRLAFGAGLFTDRSSAPELGGPIQGRGDFYGATLGLQWTAEHTLSSSAAPSPLGFTTTLALRYAYSSGTFNDLQVDAEQPLTFAAHSGRFLVHELGLYVGGGVGF